MEFQRVVTILWHVEVNDDVFECVAILRQPVEMN
jgi:hypothetical protein